MELIEGFDYIPSGTAAQALFTTAGSKWDGVYGSGGSFSGLSGASVVPYADAYSGSSLLMTARGLQKNIIPTNRTQVVFSFRYIGFTGSLSVTNTMFRSFNSDGLQVSVFLNADPVTGNAYVTATNSAGTVIFTSASTGPYPFVLNADTFYRIGLDVLYAESSGSLTIYVINLVTGVQFATTFAGINTIVTTNNQMTSLVFGPDGTFTNSAYANYYYDDLVIVNGDPEGMAPALDDRVFTLLPDADVSNSGWALSSGSQIYPLINETSTSFTNNVQAAASGSRFLENFTPFGATSIAAVAATAAIEAGQGGTVVAVSGSATVSGPAFTAGAGTGARYQGAVMTLDPNTGFAWTSAAVTAAAAGVKVT